MIEDERRRIEAELTRTWSDLGVDPPTEDALPHAHTISSEVAISSSLPRLFEPSSAGMPELVMGEVLGEGGMGTVCAATQTSLSRDVAVKLLLSDPSADERRQQLLREARITGWLEHPNVVPIHALGQDERGNPFIVMKRIEGRPWGELLFEASGEERGTEAYLRRHLGILQQVCKAIHFAHSRGVVHRDVKPDNVMVGSFGEVYVVDWGIAVTTTVSRRGVPSVGDVRRIEGTPVYLAPEMASGDGSRIGTHSDVYLLGATLHHVLTGEPPHLAPHVRATIFMAYASEPLSYPPWIPDEIVRVVRKAMARDPVDRHPSALALAEDLEAFLTHRGSIALSKEAERRAASLAEVARESPTDERVDPLFHQARFAFDHALVTWPENARALDGRRALFETMIDVELRRGTPRAAQALLRLHDAPPEALEQRVADAITEERAREERREALERDADVQLGARGRGILMLLAAAAWTGVCVACSVLTRTGVFPIDHVRFAGFGAAFFVGILVAIALRPETTLANAVMRRATFTTLTILAGGAVLWPLMGWAGLSMPAATVVGSFATAMLYVTLTFYFGWRYIPLVIGHVLVSAGAAMWPAYHFEVFACAGIAIAIAGVLSMRGSDQPAARI